MSYAVVLHGLQPYHPSLYLYFGLEMLSSKPDNIGAMGPVFSFYVDVARQLGLLHLEKLRAMPW